MCCGHASTKVTTIDKIMNVFTQVIKNHGGYVDKYSGDEVMALFGAKVASEVDTQRAVFCAIEIHDKFPEIAFVGFALMEIILPAINHNDAIGLTNSFAFKSTSGLS